MTEYDTCNRCGSPLGSTRKPTEDGVVCFSCYNQAPDEHLGEITDWYYIPPEGCESTDKHQVLLVTDQDRVARESVDGEQQAVEVGRVRVGHHIVDHGDQWSIGPSQKVYSEMEAADTQETET